MDHQVLKCLLWEKCQPGKLTSFCEGNGSEMNVRLRLEEGKLEGYKSKLE